MFIPIKLVRDSVVTGPSQLIAKPATEFPQMRETAIKLLRRKLFEEALEYLENPGVAELVDVYEVVIALIYRDIGMSDKDFKLHVVRKRSAVGGFSDLMIMGAEFQPEEPK